MGRTPLIGKVLHEFILVEALPDAAAFGGWRIKYGYQEDNPGRPGIGALTRRRDGEDGIAFAIPIAQKVRPGEKHTLRIELRPCK